MPITRFSHVLPPKSHLHQEEDASAQEVSAQERVHPSNQPSEEETLLVYIETPSPAIQPNVALNQALNQREATQTGKHCSGADVFLSAQVGNPQKAKERAKEQGFAVALINGFLGVGLGTLVETVFQTLVNKHDFQKLSAEAHSHTALASLANESEKNGLWGKINTALGEKAISNEAKQVLTSIQDKPSPSVADLHHALAGVKHLQAREALESTAFKSKWFSPVLGLIAATSVLYTTYRYLPEAEKHQVQINRRNRAILNQAGRDITVRQAKEHFPEYFSPLGDIVAYTH